MSLKVNKLLIISLEGIESNTEVNFFGSWDRKGMFNYLEDKIKGKCIALGKMGKGDGNKERYKNKMDILGHYDFIKECNKIFFIGDGDKKDDIPAMERAKNFIIKEWKKLNDKFHKNLIYDEKKSFEDILIKNWKKYDQEKIKKLFKNKKYKKRYFPFFNTFTKIIGINLTKEEEELKKILN